MYRSRIGGTDSSTARLTTIVIGYELGEGDVSGTPSWAGAGRRKNPIVSRACASMTVLGVKTLLVEVRLERLALVLTPCLRPGISVFSSSLQQDAAGFGAVWRWGSQRARHWSQAPFLDIGFNENEASLAKVDVDSCGSVGANSGEEILVLHPMDRVIEFLAVASEEDATGSRAVSASNNIALDELRRVWCMVERLVEALHAIREVSHRMFVETCQ